MSAKAARKAKAGKATAPGASGGPGVCTRSACTREKKVAWFHYFEERRDNIALRLRIVERAGLSTKKISPQDPATLPPHLVADFMAMAQELQKKLECPVCLELVTPENVSISKCGHTFHKTCFDECRTRSDKCPICRTEVGFK